MFGRSFVGRLGVVFGLGLRMYEFGRVDQCKLYLYSLHHLKHFILFLGL